MRRTAAIAAAIGWIACSGLVVHDDDTPARRHAKTWTGTALTVATLAIFPKVQAEVEHAERVRILEERLADAAARFRRLWLHRILAARTADQMTAAFRHAPLACRPSGARRQICVWSSDALLIRGLANPETPSGRLDLPRTDTTTDQIVIAACEVPADGGTRAPRSCDVSFW
jgi:hypothetical protein